MTATRLSDIIDIKVYQDLPAINSPEKTAFAQSGIVARSQLLDDLATAAGSLKELPFWRDLDANQEPNHSNDDPTVNATPDKAVQGSQEARTAYLNKGYAEMDLANELASGGNALRHVKNRIETYWTSQWERSILSVTKGLVAHNLESNSGDMVYNASTNTAVADQIFNRQNFINATFTLGDSFRDLGAIAVHSMVFKRMVEQNDIDFIADSQGVLNIPTYMGKQIIIDDSLIYNQAAQTYISVMYGAGAIGYGDGKPTTPVEVERKAGAGNGGGMETLWTRKTWLIHPFGYKVKATLTAGKASLTNTQLEAAGSWERVVERKNVPMAFLITK